MRRGSRTRLSAATCLALAASLVTAGAASTAAAAGPAVHRFDFGPPTAPVAAGHQQVTPTTAYDAQRGYGIIGAPGSRDRGAPDDLRRDFTNGAHGFVLDLPAGDYHVAVTHGDQIAAQRTGVTAEGRDLGLGSTAAGQFGTVGGVVAVRDGQLTLAFRNDARVNAVVVTPVTAPTGLRVTGVTTLPDSSVTLSWDAVDGAASYRVHRAPQADGDYAPVGEVTGTSFTDRDVELGAGYRYVVTQVTTTGAESARSAVVTTTVVDPAVERPAAPTRPRVHAATSTSRSLRWEAPAGGALYRVQRAMSPDGPFTTVAQVQDTRFTDERLPVSQAWYRVVALNAGGLSAPSEVAAAPASAVVLRQAEHLDRGAVAVRTADGVLVSWRLLGTEPQDAGFHVYRDGQRLTDRPVTASTNLLDPTGTPGASYEVAAVVRGHEQPRSAPVRAWEAAHRDIPLDKPVGGTTPDGKAYEYRANDASVGDLDGDGQLEIVLKWDPTNSQDNSKAGYTGEVLLDAYEFDGTRKWRISLGRNIRAGAHYTQFLVYDFDGDGRAEVVTKTADGTRDGTGRVIGDPAADHRNSSGYVLAGPEFLTVFDGRTGGELATTPYLPERGNPCSWGDCYGNRVDRFLAGVAHLDGERPSIVMSRGYYTRSVLAAFDFRDGKLAKRWVFDSDEGEQAYAGQGNHNLAVADVDGDGRDEVTFGAMAVDDDGSPLYTTGLGHGDALHLSDLDPARPGLEVFQVHEDKAAEYGLEMRDAATGEVLWGRFTGQDTGRGASADIDPRHPGSEAWAISGAWNSRAGGLYTAKGEEVSSTVPAANFVVQWDGDLGYEVLDHDFTDATRTGVGRIDEWDPATSSTRNLLTATGTRTNNDTKGNPVLQADVTGDWREEVIWRTDDSTALRLFATPFPTRHRLPTLLHDPVYRLGVAWQNVGYNQPPHTSYALGFETTSAPVPSVRTPEAQRVDVRVTPETWDAAGSGPAQVKARLRPPAGTTPEQVTGVQLVVNGQAVEAGALEAPGRSPWQAVFDGRRARQALAGYRGSVAVTVVAHLSDGRTLTGGSTVVLE